MSGATAAGATPAAQSEASAGGSSGAPASVGGSSVAPTASHPPANMIFVDLTNTSERPAHFTGDRGCTELLGGHSALLVYPRELTPKCFADRTNILILPFCSNKQSNEQFIPDSRNSMVNYLEVRPANGETCLRLTHVSYLQYRSVQSIPIDDDLRTLLHNYFVSTGGAQGHAREFFRCNFQITSPKGWPANSWVAALVNIVLDHSSFEEPYPFNARDRLFKPYVEKGAVFILDQACASPATRVPHKITVVSGNKFNSKNSTVLVCALDDANKPVPVQLFGLSVAHLLKQKWSSTSAETSPARTYYNYVKNMRVDLKGFAEALKTLLKV